MSRLPKIYSNNKSEKPVNNKEVFYSNEIKEKSEEDFLLNKNDKTNKLVNSLLIKKKINDIFNSPNFVYKVKVKLKLKTNKTEEVTLIAKTSDSVLTIDNESIKISDIVEIEE